MSTIVHDHKFVVVTRNNQEEYFDNVHVIITSVLGI